MDWSMLPDNCPADDPLRCLGMLWQHRNRPCILCRGSPVTVALFIPGGKQQRAGTPPQGQTWVLPYTLCQTCTTRDNVADLVEKIALAGFAELVDRPERN
jgi:hypothetical protein